MSRRVSEPVQEASPAVTVAEAPRALAPAWTIAALLIAGALAWSDGIYHPLSLSAVTVAAALALIASLRRDQGTAGPERRWPVVLLGLGVAGSLLLDALLLPGVTVDPARLGWFRPALAVVTLATATHLWPRAPSLVERLRFPLIVGGWLVLAGTVLHASPFPGVDVWLYRQGGALTLLDGRNPYTFVFRNPYGPGTTVIARELLTPDGRGITALPYPPLTLLLDVPAAALGDVRWTTVLAAAAAALAVRALGRGSRTAELAATLLLLQPATWMTMELAWTEPVVLVAVCGCALLLSRQRRVPPAARAPGTGWGALGALAGLTLAAKQYVPLLLLPLWPLLPARRRWQVVALAAAVCAATYLPFAAWDPRALWRGVVTFQLLQPLRMDALAWPAALMSWGGPRLPAWPAFLAAGAASLLVAHRARSIAVALAGAAGAWLVLVLGSKQAFCNYYWLAVGVLCAAVAAASSEAHAPRSTP